MPTDFTFRLSTYLTLALSCACVGYAEHDLILEVPYIAAGVIVSLIVIFRLETRVELLSIPAANRLGLIVGLANFAWVGYRLTAAGSRTEGDSTEWQMLLVALFGPLLMTLMPAKLARREKHIGDYWGLYGASIAAAGLAGAISEDTICFVLMGLYVAVAIWSLTLFQLRRAAGTIAAIPGRPVPPPIAGIISDEPPRSRLALSLLFLVCAAAIAVPLYLLTPQSSGEKLQFNKPRIEIGYAADQMIDLNQTGNLRANDNVAFEVFAEESGQPKADLSLDQRWRGRTMRRYVNGTWKTGDFGLPGAALTPTTVRSWSPPNLGSDQIALWFTIPARQRGTFLADPVIWAADQPVPAATETPNGLQSWSWSGANVFLPLPNGRPLNEIFRYVQVWRAESPGDTTRAFHLTGPDPDGKKRLIEDNPVPRVKEYADQVVEQLIRSGRLPANCRDRISLLPRPQFHERIARAFASHLATAPDLTYTTHLRRERKDVDPIEDFLFYTKAGHCERFATALALMLRSQRIPAVLVLGFKGCEATDEPGKYIVRHEHAHAWVDALVPVPDQPPPKSPHDVLYRWVSLDPTPEGADAEQAVHGTGWFSEAWTWLQGLINEYVVHTTPEKRRQALLALWHWFTQWEVLTAGTLAIVGFVILRRWGRIARMRSPAIPHAHPQWFDQLLALLATHGFSPEPGQTPREFATAVAERLRAHIATSAQADVPLDWAEAYYETRFGGIPLPPERRAALEASLGELRHALANHGGYR